MYRIKLAVSFKANFSLHSEGEVIFTIATDKLFVEGVATTQSQNPLLAVLGNISAQETRFYSILGHPLWEITLSLQFKKSLSISF